MIHSLFQQHYGYEPTICSQAPGRLEFIGNHTDYNGGPVIGVAVDRRINMALAPREDRSLRLWSATMDSTVEASLDSLEPLNGDSSWANYALGVLKELISAGMPATHGFDLAVDSDLPPGAGMSSSAAFELSSGYGMSALYNYSVERADMARIGRRAENNFVGVPCGILDQGVSAFGEVDRLVLIDCQTETFRQLPLPHDVHFWVFNTAKKHALLDSLYAKRHQECTQAFAQLKQAYPDAQCLADISSEQLEAQKDQLDAILYKRAQHVIGECERVHQVEDALKNANLGAVGRLLLASHESSRQAFENSIPELDFLVDCLGQAPNVWGARLTGGGFGGAVMAVTNQQFDQAAAQAIAQRYQEKFGHAATVFHTTTGHGANILGA